MIFIHLTMATGDKERVNINRIASYGPINKSYKQKNNCVQKSIVTMTFEDNVVNDGDLYMETPEEIDELRAQAIDHALNLFWTPAYNLMSVIEGHFRR